MKAIALISGGLDSILAARLIKEQGIDIIPLNFYIPFYSNQKENLRKNNSLVKAALGQELKTLDISDEFLRILENPTYGYGSLLNPCIDCKILMFSQARQLMKETNSEFVVSGEVLAQRPMSQHKQALEIIEQKSGLKELLLRPLSAQHLSKTLPEKNGWVDRSKLLNFSGRSRKPQIELAKIFGIEDYPNPAGGCLLTDPGFVRRLKDLISQKEVSDRNIELLKLGRHFRFSQKAKLIVGRNEKENELLQALANNDDYIFSPLDAAGPTCLGIGGFDDAMIRISCAITYRYSDHNGKAILNIAYRRFPDRENKILAAQSPTDSEIISYRI